MAYANTVLLLGNLTRDVELRSLPSGTKVADIRLAISDRYTSKAGKPVDTRCYVDVVVWDALAEECARRLKKGAPLLVEGRLQSDEWKDKDGQTRSKLRVRAMRVDFPGLSKPPPAEDADAPAPEEPEPTAAPPDDPAPSGKPQF